MLPLRKSLMPMSAFYRDFSNEHIKIIPMVKLHNYFTRLCAARMSPKSKRRTVSGCSLCKRFAINLLNQIFLNIIGFARLMLYTQRPELHHTRSSADSGTYDMYACSGWYLCMLGIVFMHARDGIYACSGLHHSAHAAHSAARHCGSR